MATKYLQLRVHALKCVQQSTNVQNILGIPLETDPNAIDISAIITDANAGVVAQAPPVFLGNRYGNGHREGFSPPKIVAEIPFTDADVFPRRVVVTLNMAEKDDGAGFDHLMERVAQELTTALSNEVGNALDREVRESEYYDLVENATEQIIGGLFKELGNLLGLSDDPFRPVTIEHAVAAFDHAPSGDATIELHEPSPHQGKYVLTYGWHVSTTRELASSSTSSIGSSAAALTRGDAARVPYPRPYRSFHFARPMAKKASGTKPPPKTTVKPPPKWFWPAPFRVFAKQPQR
jgi:hypothetical protein